MAADLTSAGKTGVAINAMYDFWTPARHYQAYHGGLRILTESASAKLATPISIKPEEISGTALGYSPRERTWNFLEPWMGGEWRVKDIMDYQLIAFESCLYQAALRREDFLRSFYTVGKKALGRNSPYAFVIPDKQLDPGSTRKMLETLRFGLIEIDRATAAFEAGTKNYTAGSYVIRMQQPYSSWAKTLLERQVYPDLRVYPGGPPKQPYDVTAQTLPLLMGVDVDTIAQPFTASLSAVTTLPETTRSAAMLPAGDVDSWRRVNQLWKSGQGIWRDIKTGDFSTAAAPGRKAVHRPRVALYKSFMPSMDEGWTRWLLEQFAFAYTSVGNKDLQAMDLRSKFDVIVFPDQRAATIHSGYPVGSMPEEYAGGLGEGGADALKRFANAGGTLVFLNEACEYAIERLGLNVKNVVRSVARKDFYSPGSLLNVKLDTSNPLVYGLPPEIAIWSEGSPAFALPDGSRASQVATYASSPVLASGWLLGEKFLLNRAALLDVPAGSGHIVLFGMRPQYRAQSYQSFKMFFNSFLLAE
jgi:hypothetical protein